MIAYRVGNMLEKLGDVKEAIKTYEYGLSLFAKLYQDDDKKQARLAATLIRHRLEILKNGELAVVWKKALQALDDFSYVKAAEHFCKAEEITGGAGYYGEGAKAYQVYCLLHQGLFTKAEEGFRKFLKEYPESAWTGHVTLWLGKTLLVEHFRVKEPIRLFTEGLKKQETVINASGRWEEVHFELLVCLGICHYIIEKNDEALEFFRKAKDVMTPDMLVTAKVPEGFEILAAMCAAGECPTPKFLRRSGSEPARVGTLLGDAYFYAMSNADAALVFSRFLVKDEIKGATQGHVEYAQYMLSRNYFKLKKEKEAILLLGDFRLSGEYEKSPFALEALIRLAAFCYNAGLRAPVDRLNKKQREILAKQAKGLTAQMEKNTGEPPEAEAEMMDKRKLRRDVLVDVIQIYEEIIARFSKEQEGVHASVMVASLYLWNDQPEMAQLAYKRAQRMCAATEYDKQAYADVFENVLGAQIQTALDKKKEAQKLKKGK